MLEETIPAMLSAVHGWFTPAVLFVVLNIVIGTIAVTSKAAAASATGGDEEGVAAAAGAGWETQHRRLARVPSIAFERLRSFNGRFAAAAPEPAEAGVVDLDLGYKQHSAAAATEKEGPVVVVEPEHEPEPEHAAHMERSRSEAAAAAEAELPRLPARLHKSASDKSAFAHFGAEEVEETVRAVEARRPATTRETSRGRRRFPVAEPEPASEFESESDSSSSEEEGISGGEVDARADDFINRFRHQLKLQRIDSFIRHRETVRRGQAQAAARGV
ncbi:pathogen-associated molecular patterns-induced protein A70-like [Miscanthus floridulus]|uniref:pathogen-associated molecular patterns-induced protein A70-like n=1 Tax=Miscanthus floridulus TaxID=154761 RepID=UPI0034581DBE